MPRSFYRGFIPSISAFSYLVKSQQLGMQDESFLTLNNGLMCFIFSHEGGAWYSYDTNFHKIRAAANLAWNQIHSEIYVTAFSRKQNTMPRFRSGRDLCGRDRSRGSFSYTRNKRNKGTHCARCDYRHTCICKHCGGKHPAFRCYSRPNKNNNNANNSEIGDQQSDDKSKPKPSEYPKLPTQVQWQTLNEYLDEYHSDLRHFIIDGFKFGFQLNYSGVRCCQDSPNLGIARDNPENVREKLSTELAMGRIAGPFDSAPFHEFKCSPLGLVPKRQEGQFRLIHHLSYPRKTGTSVNAGIDKEYTSVSYAAIEDAVAFIKRIDKRCFMAKTDLQSAFRILHVSPEDYPLLGFSWEGKHYYAMGCASSCLTFEKFSTALEWIAIQKLGCREVVHIFDEFLFIESTFNECEDSLNKFIDFCNHVGIPIAMDKTFSPNQVIDFVGITLDSVKMEARLPPDKIQKSFSLLQEFLQRNSCKKREMESLIGYLNLHAQSYYPGEHSCAD